MSTYWTTLEVILIIQIIAIIGFLGLAGFATYSYLRTKNPQLFWISVAFLSIAISILLKVTILPFEDELLIDKEILEAIFEGIQFIAAFFFFYGIIIKSKKEGET